MKWLVGVTVGCLALAAFLWIGMMRAEPPAPVPVQSQETVSERPAPRNTSEGYTDWLGERYEEQERAQARDQAVYDYIDEQIADLAESQR